VKLGQLCDRNDIRPRLFHHDWLRAVLKYH
jgi:hypothetical protein